MLNKTTAVAVAGVVGAFLVLGSHARADAPKAKAFAADKGPSKVDVSKYSKKAQDGYKVFQAKCSKCHTIARPINTDMKTSAWKMYVKRMMNKPDSGISPAQGKQIYGFLKEHQKAKDAAKAAAGE